MSLDQASVATQGLYSLKLKPKGDYQAHVYSDQMVLVIVRQEAEPVTWWPNTLRESWNSRQPRDLTERRQSNCLSKSLLTLSPEKMNKGDVEVDKGDNG